MQYLKVKEVMKRLGVTKPTVHRWIKEGILPAKRVGGLYFIAESDLEKILERGKK